MNDSWLKRISPEVWAVLTAGWVLLATAAFIASATLSLLYLFSIPEKGYWPLITWLTMLILSAGVLGYHLWPGPEWRAQAEQQQPDDSPLVLLIRQQPYGQTLSWPMVRIVETAVTTARWCRNDHDQSACHALVAASRMLATEYPGSEQEWLERLQALVTITEKEAWG